MESIIHSMKRPFRVYLERLQQPPTLGSLAHFPSDPLDHPKVSELRRYSEIEKVIQKRKSDFDQALAIALFTSRAWSHDGFNSNPKKGDALSILKLAKKGHSFSCVRFASVFVQLCHSVGIPARPIQVSTKRPDLGMSGHAHLTAEYFDNALKKWVWIDPQVHAYASHRGTLLSFTEFSELFLTKGLPEIHFTSRTKEYLKSDSAGFERLENFFRRYVWSARVAHLNAFYSRQGDFREATCRRGGVVPHITFQGFGMKSGIELDRERFDAPLNSLQLQFETVPPKKQIQWKDVDDYRVRAHLNYALPRVTVRFDHAMPWFDHIELRHNGTLRRVRAVETKILLRAGVNEIHVVAVNSYGRRGPASAAVIRYDNRYPNVKNYW